MRAARVLLQIRASIVYIALRIVDFIYKYTLTFIRRVVHLTTVRPGGDDDDDAPFRGIRDETQHTYIFASWIQLNSLVLFREHCTTI